MCGIAGGVGFRPREAMLSAMARAMIHRGPDDQGIYVGDEIGLAFRRLAIVDLSGGKQPMSNEDGRVRLVFNGEIYDHHLLRNDLVERCHRFVTDHSDTEVLVHGWEEWGLDLFPKLNGMFALAIWDANTRRLILARDRYGIKPLYYAPLPNGGLLFGSEIRAILASGLVPSQPNSSGLLEYFSFQNLLQKQTMFEGIYQLEPAEILVWNGGRTSQHKYWDLCFPRSRREPLATLAEEHRAILTRALRRQLAADVPVKTYLSGGIDSTAITVTAHHLNPEVTAYSCVFNLDGVGADQSVDERQFSRLVAQTYGLERIELELPQDSLQRCLVEYAASMEDLRMGVGYPVYLIAQRVARDAKVVLSGTGGDEFHAGYVGRFQSLGLSSNPGANRALSAPWWRGWKRRLKGWLRPQGGAAPEASTEAGYRNILNFVLRPHQYREAFTSDFLGEAAPFDASAAMSDFLRRCPSRDWRDKVLYVDAKTYLAGLLTFEDKVSMAHSLETRVPLLDNELVDFVLDVPFDTLWQGEVGKVLFRESVRPWVPKEIYQKPKMGFGPPDSSWYRGRLRPWIEETLSPQTIRQRGVFRPEFVRRVLDDHFSGTRDLYYLIWSFLNFEAWCQAFGFFGASRWTHARSA